MAKRIDDSHQPYKRTRKLGPGPDRSPPKLQARDWECHRGKRPYEQICVWVGEGKRSNTTNRMNRAKKKRYNKRYRAWAKTHRAALRNKGRIGTYRCHKTKQTRCK
jgi:hypothetical protein